MIGRLVRLLTRAPRRWLNSIFRRTPRAVRKLRQRKSAVNSWLKGKAAQMDAVAAGEPRLVVDDVPLGGTARADSDHSQHESDGRGSMFFRNLDADTLQHGPEFRAEFTISEAQREFTYAGDFFKWKFPMFDSF